MKCSNCNYESSEGSKFCTNCGKEILKESSAPRNLAEAMAQGTSPNVPSNQLSEIKCGNCDYIGKGKKNRTVISQILAWICVVFAPLITIIYFVATPKYRCPKCKSTFIGVKNKDGVFQGQKGAHRTLVIFLTILVGIAVMGILASVVLASLNTARQKGQDAAVKANLANLRAQAELYWDSQSTDSKDGTYAGLCKNTSIALLLSQIPSVKGSTAVCNDDAEEYAAYAELNSGEYWCVDSRGTSIAVKNSNISTRCDESVTSTKSNYVTDEQFIKDVVAEAKKSMSFPQEMDENTILTGMSAQPKAIRYEYIIHGLDDSTLSNSVLKETFKPSICEEKSLTDILDENINLEYSYRIRETNRTFLFAITKSDCQ